MWELTVRGISIVMDVSWWQPRSTPHSLFMSDCILWNIGFSSEAGPCISILVVPWMEIFDILNISPFSEYSSPWSRSSLSLTISSDLRIWPLCANKIILLSVIKTWYFLSPYRTEDLLWNFTFSKGSKKSWSGMKGTLWIFDKIYIEKSWSNLSKLPINLILNSKQNAFKNHYIG